VASAVCRASTLERRQKGNFGRGKIAFLPKERTTASKVRYVRIYTMKEERIKFCFLK